MGDGSLVVGSRAGGCHELSENICVNSVKCHKVEKISGSVSFGWVCRIWWVRVGNGSMVGGSVNNGFHELSENIWSE